MMTFTTSALPVKKVDTLEILQLQSDLHEAYEGLTESVRNLDKVSDIMDNVQTGLNLLENYGKDAIPQLNIQHGLENLLEIPAKLITVDKATEGLGDAVKAGWEKFKAGVKAVIKWIREFFSKIFNAISERFGWVKKSKEVVDKASADVLKKAGQKTVNSNATEGLSEFFKLTTLYPADMIIGILSDYNDVLKEIYRLNRDLIDKLKEYFNETNKNPLETQVDDKTETVEKEISELLNSWAKKINGSLKYIEVSINDSGSGDVVIIDAKKTLSKYEPVETTYASLRWDSKENLDRFFRLFGVVQQSTGETKAKSNEQISVLETTVDKEGDANVKHYLRIALKVSKLIAKFSLEQNKILISTARELNPLINEIEHLTGIVHSSDTYARIG